MKMFGIHVLVLTLTFLLPINQVDSMNEKQLGAAVKLIKNVCQPKSKATDVDIEKMHQGDWNIDHTAMCYMLCALNKYKLMDRDNTLHYESAMSQLKTLPERYKESTLECINQCRNSAVTTDDGCVAAYEVSKCFYFCNPDKYFLP